MTQNDEIRQDDEHDSSGEKLNNGNQPEDISPSENSCESSENMEQNIESSNDEVACDPGTGDENEEAFSDEESADEIPCNLSSPLCSQDDSVSHCPIENDTEKSPVEPADRCPCAMRWLLFLGVSAIFIIGTILRFYGIKFGFPGFFRPDEEYYVYTIFSMDGGDLNPHFFYYPTFHFYINLLVWRSYEMIHFFMKTYDPMQGLHSFTGKNMQTMYLLGRSVSAVFGAITIFVTYLIGRKFYNPLVGIMAAIFIAFNPVHSLNSHFFKGDISTTFFMTLSLYFMLLYLQEAKRRDLYWAAIIGGAAFSANYYGGFLMIPLAFTIFFRAIKNHIEKKEKFWKVFISFDTYFAPFILLIVFNLLSPYLFIDFQSFLKHFQRMVFSDRVNLYNTLVGKHFNDFYFQKPLVYSLRFCLRHTMGVGLSALSLIGILALLIRFSLANSVLLIFLLSYFFLIATGKAVFTRYYAPIAPALSLLCAASLYYLFGWIIKKKSFLRVFVFILIVSAFTAEPLYVTFKQSQILSRKDTRIIAQDWIKDNLPPAPKAASMLDYRYGKPQLSGGGDYVKLLPTVEATYRSGAKFIIIDTYALTLYSPDVEKEFVSELNSKTELMKRITFSPTPDKEKPIVDACDAFYLPLHRFGNIERPGPEIRIYKILPEKFTDNLNPQSVLEPIPATTTRTKALSGLKGKYFTNKQSNGEPISRIDSNINFDWNNKSVMPNFKGFDFSVIWDGYIDIKKATAYTFYLKSDDGSRLWIDDEMVINNWNVQAPNEMSSTRLLNPGMHSIKIAYFQESYGSLIQLSWSFENNPKQIIPTDYFFQSLE